MRGIATHTQAISAHSSVAVGMKGANKAMSAVNKQMEPAKQAKMIQEFQKQSAQMNMTTEMMSDTIDDALDNDEAEDETEELTSQVLDEIGVDIASQVFFFFFFLNLYFDAVISFHVLYLSRYSISDSWQLSAAPRGKIAGKMTEDVGSSGTDELEKRLAALRNP
ncbi:vacuolar sorting-associated 2 homolog 3 [Olea europaea subsp. europaea]|nr:vacuolar sorting-associated 2 homolog 3 [Olea europaea subsp. europaea]